MGIHRHHCAREPACPVNPHPPPNPATVMRPIPDLCRIALPAVVLCAFATAANAQDAVALAEKFAPDHLSKVEVAVKLTGRLALPAEKGKTPEVVTVAGVSRLKYDERVLSLEPGAVTAVRAYREVEFTRTVGGITQDA